MRRPGPPGCACGPALPAPCPPPAPPQPLGGDRATLECLERPGRPLPAPVPPFLPASAGAAAAAANPVAPPRLCCPRACRCDEQILPAVYAWVGASFQATPAQLGYITLGRALMQALSSPLGGVAGAPLVGVSRQGAPWAVVGALWPCLAGLGGMQAAGRSMAHGSPCSSTWPMLRTPRCTMPAAPLPANSGHFMPRGHVVAAGCWLWATMTALFALTTRLAVAMPICAINGVGERLQRRQRTSAACDGHGYLPGAGMGMPADAASGVAMPAVLLLLQQPLRSMLPPQGWRWSSQMCRA